MSHDTTSKRLDAVDGYITELRHKDDILLEKIDGRLAIAEHTNIFLDVVFILLSVVLWVVTMSGWSNQRKLKADRKKFMENFSAAVGDINNFKKQMQKDRDLFHAQYEESVKNGTRFIDENRMKMDDLYIKMKREYDNMMLEVKGTSEYYLELISISHEPDLQDRVAEYKKLLKLSDKFSLSNEERARVYYYMSLTLLEIALNEKTKRSLSVDCLQKAEINIKAAIKLNATNANYHYEKGRIALQKYIMELSQNCKTEGFDVNIYAIEESFETAINIGEQDFYVYEEIIKDLYHMCFNILNKESDRRIVYDMIVSWCEKAMANNREEYDNKLVDIRKIVEHKLTEQNVKLDD